MLKGRNKTPWNCTDWKMEKVRPLQSEVSNYQWSPKENTIAFVFANTLNTFDVQKECGF